MVELLFGTSHFTGQRDHFSWPVVGQRVDLDHLTTRFIRNDFCVFYIKFSLNHDVNNFLRHGFLHNILNMPGSGYFTFKLNGELFEVVVSGKIAQCRMERS